MESPSQPTQAVSRRIEAVDLARGIALMAMTVYHFTWDLEFFGYVHQGLTAEFGWKLFARCIASSFLFLVGVSLVLAHGNGIRWPGYWRRLAMVVGAAAAISLLTWFAFPSNWIFFGILHQIAFASLAGLLFLRVPALLTLLVAAGVIAAPFFLRSEAFDHRMLAWVGLATFDPRSNDYVPVFPWFGAVLAGMGVAKIAVWTGVTNHLAGLSLGGWSRPLRFVGRHSLAYYLIHQPAMIAALWLFSLLFPPVFTTADFLNSCERECSAVRDTPFCERYCGCLVDKFSAAGLGEDLISGRRETIAARLPEMISLCSAESEVPLTEGEGTP
ncbi:MAG: DUF1624 domain-containing protein [Rhizobiaceae bacterium]